jgi:hypothetical protein
MVGNAIVLALPQIGEHYGMNSSVSWLVTFPALGVVFLL